MIFIDTNFFLRFLLKNVEGQYKETRDFFVDASEGKHKLFTSLIVVFEVYWVISGQFKNEKRKICNVLSKLLDFKFVQFDDLELIKDAIKVYSKTNLDLEDSYNLVFAKRGGAKEFKTFDKKLQSRWKLQK